MYQHANVHTYTGDGVVVVMVDAVMVAVVACMLMYSN